MLKLSSPCEVELIRKIKHFRRFIYLVLASMAMQMIPDIVTFLEISGLRILESLLYWAHFFSIFTFMWQFSIMFYFPCNLFYHIKYKLIDVKVSPTSERHINRSDNFIVKDSSQVWLDRETRRINLLKVALIIILTISFLTYMLLDIFHPEVKDKAERFYDGNSCQLIIAMSVNTICKLLFVSMNILSISWYVRGRKKMQDAPQTYTMDYKLIQLLAGLGLAQTLLAAVFFGYSVYNMKHEFKDLHLAVFMLLLAFHRIFSHVMLLSFIWAWNDFVLHFKSRLDEANSQVSANETVTLGYNCDGGEIRRLTQSGV